MSDKRAEVAFSDKSALPPNVTQFAYELLNTYDFGRASPVRVYRRTAVSTAARERFLMSDVGEICIHGVLKAAACVLPPHVWSNLCRSTSYPMAQRRFVRGSERFRERLELVLGSVSDAQARDIYMALQRRLTERKLAVVREQSRPEPVSFNLIGQQELDVSLQRGNGAILWAVDTVFQAIAHKRGLWQAGYRPVQVSSLVHGFSYSVFGINAINTLVLAAENRYLKDRISIDAGNTAAAMRKCFRAIKSGDLLCFTMNAHAGERFLDVPLDNGGFLTLPAGAPNLSVRHDVPIHAVSVLETKSFKEYQIRISPDLRAGDLPDDPARAAAGIALAARNEVLKTVREAPDQFIRWMLINRDPKARDV